MNYYEIDETTGTKRWFKDDVLHRKDGPAVILSTGNSYWYKNGEFHRDDRPAVIYNNGTQMWYQHGNSIEKMAEQ